MHDYFKPPRGKVDFYNRLLYFRDSGKRVMHFSVIPDLIVYLKYSC